MGSPLSWCSTMVWKTCRWLFSVEFVLAALISNMWLLRMAHWRRPCRCHRCRTIGHICLTFNLVRGPIVQVRFLESQNLTRRSLPIELSMPVLTKFLWHNQGSVAPLADVLLENGRSLRFRLRVEAPVSNIWNTLV